MKNKKRVAILTGGGDCPGLNAVIRGITKKAIIDHDMEVIGIKDGYEGIIHKRYRSLSYNDVSNILTLGGTILGTSNTANPYRYAVKYKSTFKIRDLSKQTLKNIKSMDISCLVCIGGDGTNSIAYNLHKDGAPVVGVPKTIDNDIRGTELTFGFDSAVNIVTEGIDRIHTTAQSHHRIMLVEVMGRKAGWIALYGGIAGGGDVILIPEIPYDTKKIAEFIIKRRKKGKKFSIIVVAEGAMPKGGSVTIQRRVEQSTDSVRFGGVSFVLGEQLESLTGFEARNVVMGHLQRGGTPTPSDRILATEIGVKTVDMIISRNFGKMVAVKNGRLSEVSLKVVAGGVRNIPLNHRLIKTARSLGSSFGD